MVVEVEVEMLPLKQEDLVVQEGEQVEVCQHRVLALEILLQ